MPIPSIGITVSVRVCDRCYNDMGGVSAASSSMTSSFLVEDDEYPLMDRQPASPGRNVTDFVPADKDATFSGENHEESKPERQREKRSLIVDELASQIRASALTTCS